MPILSLLTSFFSSIANFFAFRKDEKIREEGMKDAELQHANKIMEKLNDAKDITDANSRLSLDELRRANIGKTDDIH